MSQAKCAVELGLGGCKRRHVWRLDREDGKDPARPDFAGAWRLSEGASWKDRCLPPVEKAGLRVAKRFFRNKNSKTVNQRRCVGRIQKSGDVHVDENVISLGELVGPIGLTAAEESAVRRSFAVTLKRSRNDGAVSDDEFLVRSSPFVTGIDQIAYR